MDPERLSTLLLTVWLLGAPAGRCAAGDCQCSCSDLPHIALTEPPPDDCCQDGRYRYTCVAGYTRKAGTSNLAICVGSKWELKLRLVCIPDPNNPPKSTIVEPEVVTTAAPLSETETAAANVSSDESPSDCQCSCSDLPHIALTEPPPDDCCQDGRYRYTCVAGYKRKVGTSSLANCVGSKWELKLRLVCIPTTPPIQTSATPTAASSSNPTARSYGTSSAAPAGQSQVTKGTSSPAPTGSHDSSLWGRQHDVPGLSIMGVLLIGCAAAATGFLCWKRRSRRADRRTQQTETAEEKLPMNTVDDAAPREVCTPP